MEKEEKHKNINKEGAAHSKKPRHRKKQIYNEIRQQIEFYFSDANLSKDRFLKQLISENPSIYTLL